MFIHHRVLIGLVAVNVLVFLAQLVGWDMRLLGSLFPAQSAYYHHWQWLTHMFLHDNLLHILFNMYVICMFGAPLVYTLRSHRFLVLYFLSALAGSALYWVLNSGTTSGAYLLGASGAAFGVVAAFAVRFPQARLSLLFLPIQASARVFVGIMVVYELFAQVSGVSVFGDNIAHLAHIGGAIMGAILAYYWRKPRFKLVK